MPDRINYFILLPLLLLCFHLETTFGAQLGGGLFMPNLVLILLFAAALLACSADFLYIVLIFGFLSDLSAGVNFGIYTLSFVFSCTLLCQMKARFLPEESFVRVAALSALGALAYNLIYLALLSLVFNAGGAFALAFVGKKIAYDIVYAAVLTYGALRLIHKEKS